MDVKATTSRGFFQDALTAVRTLERLEKLYMLVRGSGLRDALAASMQVLAEGKLLDLVEQMHKCEQALDWELTGEILRLKDLIQANGAEFARIRYGITVGGNIRLPSALPGLPDKIKVLEITVIDKPPHELQVSGNPMRTDGTLLSERIELLIGPEGIKVSMANAARRERLRSRVHRDDA
jgi:hypothetical protein